MSLEIENLSKSFGAVKAVDDVSLYVGQGELVGIIGRSGAGKSTLLRLINLLERPDRGEILWNGQDVSKLRGEDLRAWRTSCAMIFQEFGIIDRLDVITNVLIGRLSSTGTVRSLFKSFAQADRASAILELDRLGLSDIALQKAGTLSGGQKQRVAIARAMMQSPNLLLADEPVSSLDPANTKSVMDGLLQINRDHGAIVLVNIHDVDLAVSFFDRIIAMDQGRIVFDGPAHELTYDLRASVFGLEAEEKGAA